ncbi:cytosine permease [Paraburkholderia agricolaris]|uniref:Cytosine permease n=1 Tax=Paraburkholderia agricolaris TaxID=2152888 RepID=A0ABW8ZU22_9BURK
MSSDAEGNNVGFKHELNHSHSNDFTTSPVEDGATYSGWRIGVILLGALIALPAFVTGAELGNSLGPRGAFVAIIIASLTLTLFALPCAIAGASSRLSSYMLIIDAFGTTGGRCVNAVLSLSMLGWFGVIAMMFGGAMRAAAPPALSIGISTWAVIGCTLMVFTNLFGFRALDALSLIATPLKACLLLWAAWTAFQMDPSVVQRVFVAQYPVSTGVSMIVGGIVVGILLLPDITRFARSPMHAVLACGVAIALGLPLILVLAGYPSLATHERDLVPIMLKLGLGLPAMAVILFSAWSTNTYNLYASTLMWSTIVTNRPRWKIVLATGSVGSALGLLGLADQFIPYMIALSVAIPPIGGIYLTNYYRFRHITERFRAAWRWPAFAAWILAMGGAIVENAFHFALTSIPALDSFALAGVAYLLFFRTSMCLRAAE